MTYSLGDHCLDSANVAAMLACAAARRPRHRAILERERAVSYQELWNRARALARAFSSTGVGPGDRVAIFLPWGIEAGASFFGTAVVGGIAILADEALSPSQIERILAHSGAKVLVTSAEMLDRLPRPLKLKARTVLLDHLTESGGRVEIARRSEHDPAIVVFASGSTGRPSGVTLSHLNLLAGAAATVAYVGIDDSDRIASLRPFSLDCGFNQLMCAVSVGATLVVVGSPRPDEIVGTLRSTRVTILPAVPHVWLRLLDAETFRSEPLTDVRAMTNTGGRLPAGAMQALGKFHPRARFCVMDGLAQPFWAPYLGPDEVDCRTGSLRRVAPGSELRLVGEDRSKCEPGTAGRSMRRIRRGTAASVGHAADPEVSPGEITEALYASGQIAECAVTAEPDRLGRARFVVHLVLRVSGSLADIESYCHRELPGHLQPSRYVVHTNLPPALRGKRDVKVTCDPVTN